MRYASAAVIGLLLATTVTSAYAQAGSWVAAAADVAGTGLSTATASSKAEATRKAKMSCGRPTCEIVAEQQGGCVGALRIVTLGSPTKWTGQTEAEWRTFVQRNCPAGRCAQAMICSPAVATR